MIVYYIITKNGQKYYYKDGKRITEIEGKHLGARKKTASNSKSKKTSPSPSGRKKKPIDQLVPCKDHQYRDEITRRCRNKPKITSKSKKASPSPSGRKKKPIDQLVPCKDYQYRDEITRKCRNKPGYKKNKVVPKINVREPVPIRVSSQRWQRITQIATDCASRSKMKLTDSQLKVVEFMENNNGLLVVHATGLGKTLTAVTCSQCYLDNNPLSKVVFVGPPSTCSNFEKSMKETYGVKNKNKYEIYTLNKFWSDHVDGRPISLRNAFLIVDEAHNVRNVDGVMASILINAAFKADKRLLLTATPFVNSLLDLIPLINMVHGRKIVGSKREFDAVEVEQWITHDITERNLTKIALLLQDKIDIVDYKDPENYPERINHHEDIPMGEKYYEIYKSLISREEFMGIQFKSPERFYNGYRRAVNNAGTDYWSRKVDYSIPILESGKSIIYTNWLKFGIEPIAKVLRDNRISYAEYSGKVSKNDRISILERFNTNKIKVLIITRAGGESLDLKEVKNVVVLDPPWNDASLEQIVGRAIRYKSHYLLPKEERKVNVYFLSLVKPDSVLEEDAVMSGDKKLYEIIKNKRDISNEIMPLLKRESSIR
uniref:Helicase n=1 Tax=viral metagenome TaxID=1070528 RepID=A0A6C0H452_9ZZZZ